VDWIRLVQDREQQRALLGSIKRLEFLEWLSNWSLLKKNSAIWSVTRINDK
jgi:hypothetical protein